MIDAVTYPKASEAAHALIKDGFAFAPSNSPLPAIPGVEITSYPWSKMYLSARIVRVRSQHYRIEVVA
jgi:hypothetical protein